MSTVFEGDAAVEQAKIVGENKKIIKNALSAKYELHEELSGAIYIGAEKAEVLLTIQSGCILHIFLNTKCGYEFSETVPQTFTIDLLSQYHTTEDMAAAAINEVDRLKAIAEEEGIIVEKSEDPGY